MTISDILSRAAVDWTQPIELLDGTPVRLTNEGNPDPDGDYWIERVDGGKITSVERLRDGRPVLYSMLCCHPDGREEGKRAIVVRNRIAAGTVDPDLIEARNLWSSQDTNKSYQYLDGARDDYPEMLVTLAAIKRGRELERGK